MMDQSVVRITWIAISYHELHLLLLIETVLTKAVATKRNNIDPSSPGSGSKQ
jgi:hypothetical protein